MSWVNPQASGEGSLLDIPVLLIEVIRLLLRLGLSAAKLVAPDFAAAAN